MVRAFKLFTKLLAIFAVSFISITANFGSASAANPASEEKKVYIDKLAKRLAEIQSNKATAGEKRRQQLVALGEETLDLQWLARFALGRHFNILSQEKRDKYISLYREFLIHTYADKFKDDTVSGEYKIIDVVSLSEKDDLVKAQANAKGSKQVYSVDFRVRGADPKAFKIIDVIVEGVSIANSHRSQFDSVVQSEGIDAILSFLERKLKEPAGAGAIELPKKKTEK